MIPRTVGDLLFRIWYGFLSYFIAAIYTVRELRLRLFGNSHRRALRVEEIGRYDGRIAIVTGGSRGIGLEIVHFLLDCGYCVVIGSSASEQSRSVIEASIRTRHPNASVEVWYLDLASLDSVKKFADKFLSSGRRLNLLVNNAGVMAVPYEVTENGYEKHFAVNYLSHFFLTILLLPVLEESASKECKTRIVNSASCIHYVGNLNMQDLQGRQNYSKYFAYMQSKLGQVMFTHFLQSFLDSSCSNITVNCVHPGIVNTELLTQLTWWGPYLATVPILKSAKEGAQTGIYAAISRDLEGVGGQYLEECSIVEPSNLSKDKHLQKALWDESLKYLKPWLNESQYSRMLAFGSS